MEKQQSNLFESILITQLSKGKSIVVGNNLIKFETTNKARQNENNPDYIPTFQSIKNNKQVANKCKY